MKTHKDLDVYVKAIDFVTEIYKATSTFPKSELYGLTNQIRRAAVSIPSNIAEGSARNHQAEFRQFLYVSLSSAAEIDTQILIAYNLGYITPEQKHRLNDDLSSISRMLQGLIKSIKL